jgi:hypothetical protein
LEEHVASILKAEELAKQETNIKQVASKANIRQSKDVMLTQSADSDSMELSKSISMCLRFSGLWG